MNLISTVHNLKKIDVNLFKIVLWSILFLVILSVVDVFFLWCLGPIVSFGISGEIFIQSNIINLILMYFNYNVLITIILIAVLRFLISIINLFYANYISMYLVHKTKCTLIDNVLNSSIFDDSSFKKHEYMNAITNESRMITIWLTRN